MYARKIKIFFSNHFSKNTLCSKNWTYVIFFLFASGSAQNIDFVFKHFSTHDGLSHQNVVNVFQDSQSFIWISTSDGLNRYDGKRFTTFFHEDDSGKSSISSNNVFKVAEDDMGKLLVANAEGVDCFDPLSEKWTSVFSPIHYREKTNTVQDFVTDKHHHLWVATLNNIYELDKQYKVVNTYNKKILGNGIIFRIQKDVQGNIWVNRSGTLNKINPNTHEIYNSQNNSEENLLYNIKVAAVFFDKDKNTWLLSQHNELMCISSSGKIVQRIKMDSSLLFVNIIKDNNQRLWISTLGKGLWVYDIIEGTMKNYLHFPLNSNSLCRNVVNGVYEDDNQNIWIYTDNGLDFVSRKRFSFWTIDSFTAPKNFNQTEKEITELTVLKNDFWISVWDGGLLKYNPSNHKHEWYTSGPTHIDKFVWSVLPFNNEIWFGTYNGLFAFDPLKKIRRNFWSNSTYPVRHDSTAVFALFKDHHHNVWASLLGGEGVLKYDSATQHFQKYNANIKGKYYFPFNHYDAITEDYKGRIWMGSNRMKGLVSFDYQTQSFQLLFDKDNPVFQDQINCLAAQKNLLWIGSNSGLYKLDLITYKIKKYTRKDGLLNNNVNAVAIDKNGELWIGTSNGLSKLNNDSKFIHFTEDEDIPEAQINRIVVDPNSKNLYVITPHAFFLVNPDSIANDIYKLKPTLLRFTINGKAQSPDFENQYHSNVSDKYFSFVYSSPFFPSSNKVQYAYMLEGYEHVWHYVGNIDNANYNSLPSGNFKFRLKASVDGIHWFESKQSVLLQMHQPFYQKVWFLMICVLILFSITVLAFYIRYRIKINHVLFGQGIRVKIAEDIHDDISSGLTKITWLSQILKSRIQQQEINRATETVNQIVDTTTDTMNKISEIIWSSNPQHDNLSSFLSYLRNYISVYFENTETRVILNFPQEEDKRPMSPDLIRQLFLIIKESLHNIMKYASANHVTVDFTITGEQYRLFISDDGKGFCPSDKKGTGNGHLNMKKRARNIHAEITIDSLPEKGTSVTVTGKFYA